MLLDGGRNSPSLLIEGFIRPLGIQPGQLVDQQIVLPHEDGVNSREDGLLAVPGVPSLEAEARLSLALSVLGGQRQEGLSAVELLGLVQLASVELPKLSHLAEI